MKRLVTLLAIFISFHSFAQTNGSILGLIVDVNNKELSGVTESEIDQFIQFSKYVVDYQQIRRHYIILIICYPENLSRRRVIKATRLFSHNAN